MWILLAIVAGEKCHKGRQGDNEASAMGAEMRGVTLVEKIGVDM